MEVLLHGPVSITGGDPRRARLDRARREHEPQTRFIQDQPGDTGAANSTTHRLRASSGVIETIDRSIELHGPLTEEQRSSLLAIADRCPVHRTLIGDTQIRTQLLDTTPVSGDRPG